jgi:hypothetical protein
LLTTINRALKNIRNALFFGVNNAPALERIGDKPTHSYMQWKLRRRNLPFAMSRKRQVRTGLFCFFAFRRNFFSKYFPPFND